MRLKISTSHNRTGRICFILRPSDVRGDPELRGLTVPSTVGGMITISRSADTGESRIGVSLGRQAGTTLHTFRLVGGAVAGWLRDNGVGTAGVEVPEVAGVSEPDLVTALCEGLLLGAYRFERHKSSAEKKSNVSVDVLVTKRKAQYSKLRRRAEHVCAGTILARDLAHEPPNIVNPITLSKRLKTLATKVGLKCTVLDDRQLARLKMNAIVAVGKASATPARLIVLEYGGRGRSAQRPVVLVGKAITFDTGGYSIKPKDGILGMKYDKCGGMAVMGVMHAVAACRPKVPVVGVIAAAENMIAGNAYRPDDIITTLSGKTVEIVSADAEGRMVLCDALTYAQRRFKPRVLIDLATLTGGVVVALGKEAAGLFTNDNGLRDALLESGERVHERLWPLPLWDEYLELIKGDDSDLKNSAGRHAHAIVGGVFLRQFVDSKVPWAHLDIAGVADTDRDQLDCPKGATGFGVRLLMDYILRL